MTRISLTHIQYSKVFIKCGFSLRSCVSRSLIFAEKFHSLNISPPCPQPWLKPISIKFCSYTSCVKQWTGCAKLICSTSIGSLLSDGNGTKYLKIECFHKYVCQHLKMRSNFHFQIPKLGFYVTFCIWWIWSILINFSKSETN